MHVRVRRAENLGHSGYFCRFETRWSRLHSVIQSCGDAGRLEDDASSVDGTRAKVEALGGRPASSTRSSYVDFSFSLSLSSLYRSVSCISPEFRRVAFLTLTLSPTTLLTLSSFRLFAPRPPSIASSRCISLLPNRSGVFLSLR